MILMKIPWNKQLYLTVLLMLSFVSCQTKKLYFSAYKDLPLEEKQEVNTYLAEVKQAYPKNDNEIILMLSYECFLNQSVIINKKIQKEFRCAKSPDFERNLSTHFVKFPDLNKGESNDVTGKGLINIEIVDNPLVNVTKTNEFWKYNNYEE